MALNTAAALDLPLLIKGEPCTGKTLLAGQAAQALGMVLLQWHIKSTTKAQQSSYEYDTVSRLRDSQLEKPQVHEVNHYIKRFGVFQVLSHKYLISEDNDIFNVGISRDD